MNSANNSNSNEKALEVRTHDIPIADAMTEFMKIGWAPSPLTGVNPHPSIPFTKIRREKLSKQYPGIRLIFPSGSLKVRSNDSDYPFRAHSAYSWFTGIISLDCVPDSLFVMEPNGSGHDALLFIHPRSPRDSDEFYKNARHGEFWIGRRMTLEETETKYGLKVQQIESIEEFLANKKETLIIRGEDKTIDDLVLENIGCLPTEIEQVPHENPTTLFYRRSTNVFLLKMLHIN